MYYMCYIPPPPQLEPSGDSGCRWVVASPTMEPLFQWITGPQTAANHTIMIPIPIGHRIVNCGRPYDNDTSDEQWWGDTTRFYGATLGDTWWTHQGGWIQTNPTVPRVTPYYSHGPKINAGNSASVMNRRMDTVLDRSLLDLVATHHTELSDTTTGIMMRLSATDKSKMTTNDYFHKNLHYHCVFNAYNRPINKKLLGCPLHVTQ